MKNKMHDILSRAKVSVFSSTLPYKIDEKDLELSVKKEKGNKDLVRFYVKIKE